MARIQAPRLLSAMTWPGRLDPMRELSRVQSEVNRLLAPLTRAFTEREYPPIRVFTGDEGAVLVALLPGADPNAIDVTVSGDTVSLKGGREIPAAEGESTYHRSERHAGRFARNVTLPFEIEAERVQASFHDGVLELRLPRVESQKPRKIQITTS